MTEKEAISFDNVCTERDALRAEVERLKESNAALEQSAARHYAAYQRSEEQRVALMDRCHNQREEINRLLSEADRPRGELKGE